MRRLITVGAVVALALGSVAMPATAGRIEARQGGEAEGMGEGLQLVGEIPFESGSHLELTTIKGRDYAFVSQLEGTGTLRIIDVTTPEKPRQVSTLPCTGYQGNIQVSHDRKTLLVGLDESSESICAPPGAGGFLTIDIRDPKEPELLAFTEIGRGSHSLAAHPTKPFLYNGQGFVEQSGEMEIYSIKDPSKPKLVNTLDTGVHSAHDLAFNSDGSMAATANVFNLHLLDTSNPADPKIVFTTQCPGCVHNHEARFTPDGKRLVVNDEYIVSPACPGGFMYFYDIVRSGSAYSLDLTGTYTPDDVGVNKQNEARDLCTAHVFDISADGTKIAASWHHAGLKYLDITDTSGVTVGAQQVVPGGVKQLGWYINKDGDTFSAKLLKGPYIYTVDSNFGFQVFRATTPAD